MKWHKTPEPSPVAIMLYDLMRISSTPDRNVVVDDFVSQVKCGLFDEGPGGGGEPCYLATTSSFP
jgi:hypothetical protein